VPTADKLKPNAVLKSQQKVRFCAVIAFTGKNTPTLLATVATKNFTPVVLCCVAVVVVSAKLGIVPTATPTELTTAPCVPTTTKPSAWKAKTSASAVEDPTTTAILTARAKCAIASRTTTELFQDPKKKTKTGTALTAVTGLTKEKTTVSRVILTSTVGTNVSAVKDPTTVAGLTKEKTTVSRVILTSTVETNVIKNPMGIQDEGCPFF